MKLPEADAGGHVAKRVGLRPLACWDCGILSRRGHGCLSVVESVMRCASRGLCDWATITLYAYSV
jgi:hypothetical protein